MRRSPFLIFPALSNRDATGLLILTFFAPCPVARLAAWPGWKSHFIFSQGRFLWNESTAAWTPSSCCMNDESICAASRVSGKRHVRSPSARRCDVRARYRMGSGPAPALATTEPQNGWLGKIVSHLPHISWSWSTYSPKKGITNVGRPYFRPHARVPAPPWCTTAETCWKSHSWGQSPMK
jgi:hypothetical protein